MTDQVSAAIIRSNPPALGVPPGCSRVVEVRGGRSILIAGPTALDRNGEVVGKGNLPGRPRECSKISPSHCNRPAAPPPI